MNSRDVVKLVEKIKPLLAGHDADIQGAALADLLAIYLAGHIIVGEPAKTEELRESLLDMHVDAVRALTKINAKLMEPKE